MKSPYRLLLVFIILLTLYSCGKLKDYFRAPETGQLVETIHTSVMVGYAAGMAMGLIEGQSFPDVRFTRSNEGFPCTTLMVIDAGSAPYPFEHEKASAITIAGLWSNETTAILSLVFTNYTAGTATFDLLGIQTVPVIRNEDHITVALADMDVQLNPDQEAILSLNLNTLEVESELIRLDMPRPGDVYVAVQQNAYFVDVYTNSTANNINDDSYTITGGGQLIEVSGSDAEIMQQAMVEVQISPDCGLNPVGGMALMKVTGLKDEGFPELGTAVFDFKPDCKGMADIFIATGKYAGSNGRSVSFRL